MRHFHDDAVASVITPHPRQGDHLGAGDDTGSRCAQDHKTTTGLEAMADLEYEVSFKGVASPTLRAAFRDCEPQPGDGVTWVRCAQDDLADVLARIEEFGLDLLDVRLVAHPSEE
jgi:hypothetical protein